MPRLEESKLRRTSTRCTQSISGLDSASYSNASDEDSSVPEHNNVDKQYGINPTSTKRTRLKRRRRSLTSSSIDDCEDAGALKDGRVKKQRLNRDCDNDSSGTTNPTTNRDRPLPLLENNPGLNWDWVAILDQDPTGNDYFPPCYDTSVVNFFLGEEMEKPPVADGNDLPQHTNWILARVKEVKASHAVVKMMSDPNVWYTYPADY